MDIYKYEYVAPYINALAFVVKNHKAFVKNLKTRDSFRLKETRLLDFYFGANFERYSDHTLCMSLKKYIKECFILTYEKMFGKKSKIRKMALLDKNNYPELDDSELLDEEGYSNNNHLLDHCNGLYL